MVNKLNSRVIINGDDFGMSPGINQAIIKLHQQDRMNSTSIMANMPWSEEALNYAQTASTLEVGIHLNVSTGKPVLPVDRVPSLATPEGQFHDLSAFLSRLLAGRIRRSELMLELEAQFELFLDHGIQPVHVDSHMHFHAVPALNEIVSELASRYVKWAGEQGRQSHLPSLVPGAGWRGTAIISNRYQWLERSLRGDHRPSIVGR